MGGYSGFICRSSLSACLFVGRGPDEASRLACAWGVGLIVYLLVVRTWEGGSLS